MPCSCHVMSCHVTISHARLCLCCAVLCCARRVVHVMPCSCHASHVSLCCVALAPACEVPRYVPMLCYAMQCYAHAGGGTVFIIFEAWAHGMGRGRVELGTLLYVHRYCILRTYTSKPRRIHSLSVTEYRVSIYIHV